MKNKYFCPKCGHKMEQLFCECDYVDDLHSGKILGKEDIYCFRCQLPLRKENNNTRKLSEFREKLKQITKEYDGDPEVLHLEQDNALLEFINDKEVTKIFNNSPKWYA